MTVATVKRVTILRDLDADYGRRRGFVGIAWKDRNGDDPRHFGERFFRWPEQRSGAAAFVKELVESGFCVWKPTSVLSTPARAQAVPSNVLSFEVDQVLSDEAWQLLEQADATLISSGTEGHVHVKVRINEELPHGDLAHLTEHLARACGVSGRSDSGGKWQPHDLLRVVGTFNTKHDPPVEVAVMRSGKAIPVETLRSILAPFDAPTRTRTDVGAIEPEAIDWGTVPAAVRAKYREIAIHDDASAGFRFFLERCVTKGLSRGQALSWCLEDPEGLVPERYSRRSLENQIDKAYREIAAPPGKQTPPTDQVSGEKETGMRPTANHTNQRPKKMWGYGDIMSTQFSPPKFTVRNLIAPGATILIGAPKVGKSFWLLNLVLSVASGRQAFGHFDTRQTGVLYLYLEGGGARSIQSRIVSQQNEVDERLPIMFALEWDGFDDGGVAKLDSWLEEHSDVGLVVVDTLAAFRGGGTADRNPWKADYKVLSELSALGHKHDCAIVVAHHDKKGEESDFVNSASGTKGLSAACDGIIKLDRERNTVEGKMRFVGRELADGFWNVEYEDLTWKVVDAPPLKKGAETLKAILDFVGTRHVKVTEIIEALTQDGTYKAGAIRQCVHRAKKAKHPRLMQDDDGRYYQP